MLGQAAGGGGDVPGGDGVVLTFSLGLNPSSSFYSLGSLLHPNVSSS